MSLSTLETLPQHASRRRTAGSSTRASPNVTRPHHADTLSFMRRRRPAGHGIDSWVVEGTGNYGSDCAIGADLANEFLSFIGKNETYGNGSLLASIVIGMIERVGPAGRLSGIEVAFLNAINRHAQAAAIVVRELGVALPD